MTEPCHELKPIESSINKDISPESSAMPKLRGNAGYPIVLTGDRTLFADYRILLEGMMSASQTSVVPSLIMRRILARPVKTRGIHAVEAPLGLRRIEAALCAAEVIESDIVITPPEHLSDAVGPKTRIIGISSGDPLGIGMSSTTMTGIAGGEIYVSQWFRSLAHKINRLRQSAPQAKVIMGGAGAWQLVQDKQAQLRLGIDHIVTGYCEGNVSDVFARILSKQSMPSVIRGQCQQAENIQPLRGATLMGSIEISRGCGYGCKFCTLAKEPMRHVHTDTILSDASTNLAAGVRNITLITEDAFRYGARGHRPEPQKLISLLRQLRSLDGLSMIQTDHANIISLPHIEDEQLQEIRHLMTGADYRDGLVWLNLGVETASGRLLSANGGKGKMGDLNPDDWGDICLEQTRRLTKLGYFPLISLIMGLPGETDNDVENTLRWVNELGKLRTAVFPVFYAPLSIHEGQFGTRKMSKLHWRLFRACYSLNFKHMPTLFWDNQTRGGVSLVRRLLMQMLGHGQIWWWRSLFLLRSRRLLR